MEQTEDAVENSFVKLWEKREEIESEAGIKPYLYRTVHNRCLDILRKRVHRDMYMLHVVRLPKAFSPDIVQKLIISEAMGQVYASVEKLPAKFKKLFYMTYVHGRQIKEIAADLDLPIATVKSQKRKMLEILREYLLKGGLVLITILVTCFSQL